MQISSMLTVSFSFGTVHGRLEFGGCGDDLGE